MIYSKNKSLRSYLACSISLLTLSTAAMAAAPASPAEADTKKNGNMNLMSAGSMKPLEVGKKDAEANAAKPLDTAAAASGAVAAVSVNAAAAKPADTKAYDQLVAALRTKNARFRDVEHPAEGQCDKVAALRGSTLDQSAKAILVSAEISKKQKDYYLLVLAAPQKVDFNKVKVITKAKHVQMATAARAQELTGCVMGAIPPFSFNQKLKMIVDPVLVADKEMEMAFNAGRLDRSIFLKVEDYLGFITSAIRQSISQ